MLIGTMVRALAIAVAVLGCAYAAARADECERMARAVKTLVDKHDPTAKGAGNETRLCAAYAEGLGLIKTMRVVTDECLDEGDERTKTLADLDRSIRNLQSQIDKNCG